MPRMPTCHARLVWSQGSLMPRRDAGLCVPSGDDSVRCGRGRVSSARAGGGRKSHSQGGGGGDDHHPCRRQHRGQCQWAAGSCLEGFVGACQASTMRRSGASPEPAANAGAHRVSETCPDARGAVQAGRGGMPLTHADASMHASGLQPQASAARPHCAQPALARLTLSGEPAGAPGR